VGYRASSKIGRTLKMVMSVIAMRAKGKWFCPKYSMFGANSKDFDTTVPLMEFTVVTCSNLKDTNMILE